jgi:hypothetical protein
MFIYVLMIFLVVFDNLLYEFLTIFLVGFVISTQLVHLVGPHSLVLFFQLIIPLPNQILLFCFYNLFDYNLKIYIFFINHVCLIC